MSAAILAALGGGGGGAAAGAGAAGTAGVAGGLGSALGSAGGAVGSALGNTALGLAEGLAGQSSGAIPLGSVGGARDLSNLLGLFGNQQSGLPTLPIEQGVQNPLLSPLIRGLGAVTQPAVRVMPGPPPPSGKN